MPFRGRHETLVQPTHLTLRVRCETQHGETLHVVGNIPALGCWQVEQAVSLVTTPASYPVWYTSKPVAVLHPGRPINYSYVVFSGGQASRFENRAGHRTITPTGKVFAVDDSADCTLSNHNDTISALESSQQLQQQQQQQKQQQQQQQLHALPTPPPSLSPQLSPTTVGPGIEIQLQQQQQQPERKVRSSGRRNRHRSFSPERKAAVLRRAIEEQLREARANATASLASGNSRGSLTAPSIGGGGGIGGSSTSNQHVSSFNSRETTQPNVIPHDKFELNEDDGVIIVSYYLPVICERVDDGDDNDDDNDNVPTVSSAADSAKIGVPTHYRTTSADIAAGIHSSSEAIPPTMGNRGKYYHPHNKNDNNNKSNKNNKKKRPGRWTARWDDNALLSRKSSKSASNSKVRIMYVGCPRSSEPIPEDERDAVTRLLAMLSCVPVFVKPELHEQHYMRYCQGTLKPAMHNVVDVYGPLPTRWWNRKNQGDAWTAYTIVNQQFADKVVEIFHVSDLIWVHGNELLLLPSFLARRLRARKALIGLFLHTPFPSSEIFRTLSVRNEILRGMLNADQIGVHSYGYARHFLTCCRRILGLDYINNKSGLGVEYQGRQVVVTVCHAGIEVEHVARQIHMPHAVSGAVGLRRRMGDTRLVVVGIDPETRVKGVIFKLLAFEQLMETRPEWRERVCLYQIAPDTEAVLHTCTASDSSASPVPSSSSSSSSSSSPLRTGNRRSSSTNASSNGRGGRGDGGNGRKKQTSNFSTASNNDPTEGVYEEPKLWHSNIDVIVDRINDRFPTADGRPVVYYERRPGPLSLQERVAVWAVGHVYLYTPVSDGLCLDPFEFLAVHGELARMRKAKSKVDASSTTSSPTISPTLSPTLSPSSSSTNKNSNNNNTCSGFRETRQQQQHQSPDDARHAELKEALHKLLADDISSRQVTGWGDSPPVMILSEFTAVARVLSGSLRVNPWRGDAVTSALMQALSMSQVEREQRNHKDLNFVHNHELTEWAERVLTDLKRSRVHNVGAENEQMEQLTYTGIGLGLGFRSIGFRPNFAHVDVESMVRAYRQSLRRVILLDFGGTVAAESDGEVKPFQISKRRPLKPSKSMMESLAVLSADTRNTVFIVSGKETETLMEAFGSLSNLGLAAEHGYFLSWGTKPSLSMGAAAVGETPDIVPVVPAANRREWEMLDDHFDNSWMELSTSIMHMYTQRTTGTYVECKGSAILWQYRDADPEFGVLQAKELRDHLGGVLTSFPVDVMAGKGYVEVRPSGCDKGKASQHILYTLKERNIVPDFILAIGDDVSDERTFEDLLAYSAKRNVSPQTHRSNINKTHRYPITTSGDSVDSDNYNGGGNSSGNPVAADAPITGLADGGGGGDAGSGGGSRHSALNIFTCVVGKKPSKAQFFVNDVSEVNELLGTLTKASRKDLLSQSLGDIRLLDISRFDHNVWAPGGQQGAESSLLRDAWSPPLLSFREMDASPAGSVDTLDDHYNDEVVVETSPVRRNEGGENGGGGPESCGIGMGMGRSNNNSNSLAFGRGAFNNHNNISSMNESPTTAIPSPSHTSSLTSMGGMQYSYSVPSFRTLLAHQPSSNGLGNNVLSNANSYLNNIAEDGDEDVGISF